MAYILANMRDAITKLYRLVVHPDIAYMLFKSTGEFCENKKSILGREFDFWPTLEQFYGSNKRKGLSKQESMRMALLGYGCYKGWEVS